MKAYCEWDLPVLIGHLHLDSIYTTWLWNLLGDNIYTYKVLTAFVSPAHILDVNHPFQAIDYPFVPAHKPSRSRERWSVLVMWFGAPRGVVYHYRNCVRIRVWNSLYLLHKDLTLWRECYRLFIEVRVTSSRVLIRQVDCSQWTVLVSCSFISFGETRFSEDLPHRLQEKRVTI